jgi:hypothetical protein
MPVNRVALRQMAKAQKALSDAIDLSLSFEERPEKIGGLTEAKLREALVLISRCMLDHGRKVSNPDGIGNTPQERYLSAVSSVTQEEV